MSSNDVILNKILSKAKIIEEKRKKDMIKKNGFLMISFFLGLCISLFKLIEIEIPHHFEKELTYGSVIYTDDNICVYVTIGVCMFIIGVTFTIICKKLKNKGG